MTKKKLTLFLNLILICLLGLIPLSSKATHIVGGEMNYTCLGDDQYEITLVIFRDCFNGNPNAWFDDPASIGIFDSNNILLDEILIPLDPMLNDTLNPVLNSECLVIPPDVCVHTTTYRATVRLPRIAGGYQLAYQRCCRNVTIKNIIEPLATGATYGVTISEKALEECNSNPKFNDWPPLFICVNEPINFDQSAFDTDGDSIVYRLCTPLQGANPDIPRPQPPNSPPYDEIIWIDPPYSVDNMLNGLPGGEPLAINPETGLLTGLPNTIGQFVVGVCVEEYRNGEIISTTRRDFQYNVGVCGRSSAAFFAPEFQCNDLTVEFDNQSLDADTYLWSFNDPNNPSATSTSFSPSYTYSEPGMYEVELIVDPGTFCADTFSQIINLQLSNLDIDFSVDVMDCVDSYDIAITDLSTDDLSTPSEWMWEIVGTGLSSTEQNPVFNLAGVSAGDYTIEVSILLENGCSGTESRTITITEALTFSSAFTNPLCNGDLNGSASISVSGGTPPYTYLWATGEETSALTDLGVGNYSVTVTTANNCEIVEDFVLTQSEVLSSRIDVSYASCDAPNSGVAVLTAEGGTEPYTYLWSNGETSATLTGVAAGTYTVTVSDANECMSTNEVILLENGGITANITAVNVTCFGANDGSIDVDVSGGFGEYIYAWDSGQTIASIEGLSAGTFTVTITDSGGCSTIETITISETTALSLSIVVLNAACRTDTALGTACAGVLGGAAPYSYVWSNGATTAMIENLEVGTYTVTATDANGCIAEGSATVNAYIFDVNINASPIACAGELSDVAIAEVNGGQSPFEFIWSNEATTTSLNDLSPGTYAVTVSDAMGCTTSTSISIVAPDALAVTASSNDISCNGIGDGIASVNVTGGTSPYTYAWSNDATTQTINNLETGEYTVTITDANDCTINVTVTIKEPSSLMLSLSAPSSVCITDADGTIGSSVEGGTPPYTYAWSNGETTPTLSNLTGGDFSLTVTDANACIVMANASIESLESPICSIAILQPIVSVDGDEGVLEVSISNGEAPYDFTWSNGDSSLVISDLTANTYVVSVTDANGCMGACQMTISAPPPAKIGNFVWDDFDRDGIQDETELGIPNVFVSLRGTNIFGEDILTATYTDPEGKYLFGGLNAGTYQVGVEKPDGFVFAALDQGEDDEKDSDVSSETGMMPAVTVDFGDCILRMDGGFYRVCENVRDPGEIGFDQFLCFPGEDPEPIGSVSGASGGQGEYEYIWMQANLFVPFTNSAWSIIEGATEASYDPGPLDQTTFFARCVRTMDCIDFKESNVVKITIGSGAISPILGPEDACLEETYSYGAGLGGNNVTYNWNFGEDASPATSTLQFIEVSWSTIGDKTIRLDVDQNGCMTTVHKTVRVTESSAICGNGFVASSSNHGEAFNVYPNPLQDKVTIAAETIFETDMTVEVMDIHGKKIKTVLWASGLFELSIDLSAYASGVYYLNVQSENDAPTLLRLVKL